MKLSQHLILSYVRIFIFRVWSITRCDKYGNATSQKRTGLGKIDEFGWEIKAKNFWGPKK